MKKVIILLLLFSAGCKSQHRIEKISDGDSFVLANGERIRLYDVDCPELKQAWGREAKAFAERHLLSTNIKLERHGRDKYNRILCRINASGEDFSYLLISAGLAHPSYQARKSLKNAYFNARRNKVGLFSQNWIYPSQHRKLNRK